MRIDAIQPLAELTEPERQVLADSEVAIDRLSDYVLYVLSDESTALRLLAPMAPEIRVGSNVEIETRHIDAGITRIGIGQPSQTEFQVVDVAPRVADAR